MIVPEGKIATGKLAQALMHGARVIALRGNFDQALELVRELAERHPIALVNSVNEFRLEGQKTAAFELVEELGELDLLCIPVGNAGNVTAYWKGFKELGAAAAAVRLPGRGRGAARARRAGREPETVASAIRIGNPARWEEAMAAFTASRGEVARGDRRGDPRRLPPARRAGGRLLRAGLGGRVAGLLKYGAEGAARVACVLTGHGLKDPQTALERAGAVVPCEPEHRAPSSAPCWADAPPPPRPRPRLARPTSGRGSTRSRRRSALHVEVEVVETGPFAVDTDLDRPGPHEPVVRGVRALHAGRRLRVPHHARRSRSSAAWGRAPRRRRRAAGGRPPVRARRRPARARHRARGPSRQRRGRAARRLRGVRRRRGRALRPPAGLEAVLVVPHEPVRTERRARRCRREVPMADAVFNVAHGALLVLGLARGDWDLVARGLADRLHQPRRAHLYPRSMELVRRARDAGRARRDDLRRRPDRAGLDRYEQTGAVVARAARGTEGWADVLRAPFEPMGADVREL